MDSFIYKFVFYLCLLFSLPVKAVEVALLTFADVYEIEPSRKSPGLRHLTHTIRALRASSPYSLVLVSGDVLSINGSKPHENGKQVVKVLNEMKVDLASLGNHEFALGVNYLKQRIKESNFDWLGTNVFNHNVTQQRLGAPPGFKIYTFDGIKIGIIGLCLPKTAQLYKRQCKDKIVFSAPILAAKKAISALKREKVDVIIAMTHLDFEQDKKLAEACPEINIIVGGHDHSCMSLLKNHTLIHKVGSDANYLGYIKMNISKSADVKTIIKMNWSTLNTRMIPTNPEILG